MRCTDTVVFLWVRQMKVMKVFSRLGAFVVVLVRLLEVPT